MTDTSNVSFSSVRSISKLVQIFYIIAISATLIGAVLQLMEINLLNSLLNEDITITDEEVAANDFRVGINAVFIMVAEFIALILFFIWFHKCYRNLSSFGAKELSFSSRWVVLYFFIPILWFYKPYGATKEIWKSSDPTISTSDKTSRKQVKTPSLIKTWWALWIITSLIGWFYLRSFSIMLSADAISEIIALDYMDLITDIPIVISDVLTFFLVREISVRQEKRGQLLT